MEYTMSNAPGRFDMIAIRRTPDSTRKHRIALIELKVRSDRYGGFGSKQYDDKEKHTKYVEVETKGKLFDYPNLKYGSGLLGHMADYLRYLHKDFYNNGDGNNSPLIKEISQILEWHKEFGILPECLHNVSSKDLALKPEIIFVSYTDVPSLNGKCEYEDVMSMKKTFYKYMYKSPIDGEKTSKYSVERMLTKDNVKGLMAVRDTFCSEHPQIEFKLEINEKLYDFRFVFVDTRESDKNVWECI